VSRTILDELADAVSVEQDPQDPGSHSRIPSHSGQDLIKVYWAADGFPTGRRVPRNEVNEQIKRLQSAHDQAELDSALSGLESDNPLAACPGPLGEHLLGPASPLPMPPDQSPELRRCTRRHVTLTDVTVQ
jgi:hypothetical protein